MKYYLNPQFSLTQFSEISIQQEFQSANYSPNHPILIKKPKGRVYIINRGIAQFIQCFETPKTKAEVVSLLTNNAHSKAESAVAIFFDQMLAKKIILPVNKKVHSPAKKFFFEIGNTIGEYRVLEQLSNKSSVDIYKVLNPTGEIYVVKLVHPLKFIQPSKFETAKKYLHQEYDLLKMLQSTAAVVRVIDFIEEDEIAYVVMEFVKGESLQRELKGTQQEISKKLKLQWIMEILQAFSDIHSENVVHGDIHASNFIVSNENIRLIDFGHGFQQNSSTKVERIGGIERYMPPERIQDSIFKKFIKASDFQGEVYQLGILIYFIAYGKTPFTALTWKQLAQKINHSNLNISTVFSNPIVQLQWRIFLEQSLAKNPNHRFASAQEMNEFWKNNIQPYLSFKYLK